jgi:hypothetical protein
MEETWPLASIVTWEFPARQGMPPVRIVWYDGGVQPPRPAALEPDRRMPAMGIIYVGDKGIMMADGTGIPRIIPESKMNAYKMPPKTLARRGGIYDEWFQAVNGGDKPSEHWPDCAVPLSEIVLLGNLALLMKGQRLEYDGPNMRFTNSDQATKLHTTAPTCASPIATKQQNSSNPNTTTVGSWVDCTPFDRQPRAA